VTAVVAAALIALVAAGCGPAAVPSGQVDVRDLLDRAVATFATTQTVHAHVELAGKFRLDLDGSGAVKVVDLAGATVDADIDLANVRGSVAFAIPAYLNFGGEILQLGPQRYVRTGLDGKYAMSIDPLPGPASVVTGLQDVIRGLQSPPTKSGEESCGADRCSKVSVSLAGVDLSGTGLPVAGATTGETTLDVWVRIGDGRPVKVAAVFDGGDAGKLWATITLSAFDVPVTIQAPAAADIQAP
jgi:hypothetical protein